MDRKIVGPTGQNGYHLAKVSKNILFLTGCYLPCPSANGVIVEYIINELKLKNYRISCISVNRDGKEPIKEVINNTIIHRVSPSAYTNFLSNSSKIRNPIFKKIVRSVGQFFRKLKMLVLFFNFPAFDLKQTSKVFNKINELNTIEDFDCIIAIFKPTSNIAAIKKIKKKFPKIICGVYYLDLLTTFPKSKIIPNFIFDFFIQREFNDVLAKTDFSLIAEKGKSLYKPKKNNNFKNKVNFVDFPTFTDMKKYKSKIKVKENDNKIQITYAGSLNSSFRNPDYILKVLKLVSEELGSIELNLYGKHDCKDIFEKYKTLPYLKINDYGMITHEKVLKSLNQADLLLNISNSNSMAGAVPSKIFELFATGKPIINVISNENDLSKEYFDKYPLVFTVAEKENPLNLTKDLTNFIKTNKNKSCDFLKLAKIYRRNNPKHIVKLIEAQLDGFS